MGAKALYRRRLGYTGFTISSLYTDEDEFFCFLVELEPHNCFYVTINKYYNNFKDKINLGRGIYDIVPRKGIAKPWRRYRLCIDGKEPEPYEGVSWKKDNENYLDYGNHRFEVDKFDKIIEHIDSPYKVAGVDGEKKYLPGEYIVDYKGNVVPSLGSVIPAVKRGDKYLNLISMEEFEYERELDFNKIPFQRIDNHIC